MTLGDKTAHALSDPQWLPNDRGAYDCPDCGRRFHRLHEECPACEGRLRRPVVA
jgi:rubrerythrin